MLLLPGCAPVDADALRPALACDDWRACNHAIQALAATGPTPDDLERLRVLARRHPAALVRTSATFALGGAHDASALPVFRAQLLGGDGGPRDPTQAVRRAAAFSLGMIDDDRATSVLLRALDDPMREVGESVESALANRISRSELLDRVHAGLASEEPRDRLVALDRIRSLADDGAFDRVVRLLTTDRSPRVRARAAAVLADLELTPTDAVVLGALGDDEARVRGAALGLVRAGASSAVASRADALLEDRDADVRDQAADAVARLTGSSLPRRFVAAGLRVASLDDEVSVTDDGHADLVRTWVLSVAPFAGQVDTLELPLPVRVTGVTEATFDDAPVSWRLAHDGRRPSVVIEGVTAGSGEPHTLAVRARLDPGFERALGGGGRFVYDPDVGDVAPARSTLRLAGPVSADGTVPAPTSGAATVAGDGPVPGADRTLSWDPIPGRIDATAALPVGARVRASARPAVDAGLGLGVIGAAALLAAFAIRRCWRRNAPGDDDRILVILACLGALLFLTPHPVEDDLQYIAYARSLVLDGDLHILDEYFFRNADLIYAPDPRVPYGPVGAAVFWVPALALAHVATTAAGLVGWGAVADGTSLPYTAAMQLCAMLLGLGTWLLALRMARRRWSRWASLVGVAGAAFGTNALMFQYMWTGASHAPSLFLATAFLYVLDLPRRDRWGWLLCGVVAGLMIVTRSQNLPLLALALLVWARDATVRGARALPGSVGLGVVFLVGLAIGFSPQAAVSSTLDGSPVSDLYGLGRGRFTLALYRLGPMLLGGRPGSPFWPTGVLVAMPLVAVATLGIARLVRREPFSVLVWTLAVASQLVAVTAYVVWWGRMFLATSYLIDLFAIGAVGLAGVVAALEQRAPRLRPLWATLVALACLPSVRAVLLESAWRQTSLPARRTDFSTYVLRSVFLPDLSIHDDWIERRGNLAWPLRSAVEAARTIDPGHIAIWLVAAVALVGVGWGVAAVTSRLDGTRRPAAVTLGALTAPIALFVGLVIPAGRQTDLEFDYDAELSTWGDYEVQPILRVGDSETRSLELHAPYASDSVDLVTFGRDVLDLPTGTPLARVTLHVDDGRTIVRDLRAGIETADTEVENPDRVALHGLAEQPVQHRRIRDHATRTYAAHAYRTSFDLDPPGHVTSVDLQSLAPHGELWLTNLLTLDLPPEPGWRETRSARWVSYR